MMQLSEHFSLEELTRSETAARRGIKNSPPPSIVSKLRITAQSMEVVRRICGNHPIVVFSGYRSPQVNKLVGGSETSSHKAGEAVDFKVVGQSISETINLIRNSDMKFDQLIDEFNSWVHIGFGLRFRKQILSARKVSGKTIYTIM